VFLIKALSDIREGLFLSIKTAGYYPILNVICRQTNIGLFISTKTPMYCFFYTFAAVLIKTLKKIRYEV
jgi:hypothetical protein